MIKKWKADTEKKDVTAKLMANGALVGSFIEAQARARLEAIREPQWGAAYRNQIVSRLLTNEVEKTASGVTIRVCVKVGPSGYHHGFYIEVGSATAPAQPFLRPALFENKRQILNLLANE